jgi:hypothetical protein
VEKPVDKGAPPRKVAGIWPTSFGDIPLEQGYVKKKYLKSYKKLENLKQKRVINALEPVKSFQND